MLRLSRDCMGFAFSVEATHFGWNASRTLIPLTGQIIARSPEVTRK